MQTNYSYNDDINTEFTNKRRKIEIPTTVGNDSTAILHNDSDIEIKHKIHNIIDLTENDTKTYQSPLLVPFKPIKDNQIVKWKILYNQNKKKHKELAQKIRYEQILKLCDYSEYKVKKIYELLDCKQYVNIGEDDIIYYDANNPKNYKIILRNHGEPIKRLFIN